jgi:hypothetical protein
VRASHALLVRVSRRTEQRHITSVIWRWLYTVSYQQWLWSALMVNQFADNAYSAFCHGAGSTLEALAGILPGPALATPDQLKMLAGALAWRCVAQRNA